MTSEANLVVLKASGFGGMRRKIILGSLAVVAAVSTCQANSDFVAFMNSQIGTWEHTARQTGPEPMEWTTAEVVTRKGSGASLRWQSKQRTVFADGELRNESITTRLIKGGGWQFDGVDLSGRFYPGGKASMRIKHPQSVSTKGKWLLKGRKTMQITFWFGGYRNISTTTILSAKQWRSVVAASDGSRTGLGSDDKTISTLDSDGVMYAAIQGLVEELQERDRAMAARDKTIEDLKSKLQAVEERLDSLPPKP